MVGTPRLGTPFRAGEAFGQIVDGLENQFTRNVPLVFRDNLVAEILFEILADNEDEFAKSGIDSIIDRIIHDGFTIGAQSIQLFQATVTTAHTGSQ